MKSASAVVDNTLYIVGGVSDESNYYSRLTTEKITKEISSNVMVVLFIFHYMFITLIQNF